MYLAKERIRNRTKAAFLGQGFTKGCKTREMLGCTWDQFKIHIEKQFSKGMRWSNRELWHIDHIVPLASAQTPEDLENCQIPECWKRKDIHPLHDVDIFIDEGATIFPSDSWSQTPLWLRVAWAQHRHRGIRMLMLTQDYMSIDINARRMLWRAYYMKKLIGSRDISPTLPPLHPWTIKNFFSKKKLIWGVYSLQEFDPLVLKLDTLALLTTQLDERRREQYEELRLTGRPSNHLITTKKVGLYNTMQDVKEWKKPK